MERRGFAFASKALNPILSLRGENRIRFCLKSFESYSFASRREQDSNLRASFAGYTLSRRASSTTRAPLLFRKRLQR